MLKSLTSWLRARRCVREFQSCSEEPTEVELTRKRSVSVTGSVRIRSKHYINQLARVCLCDTFKSTNYPCRELNASRNAWLEYTGGSRRSSVLRTGPSCRASPPTVSCKRRARKRQFQTMSSSTCDHPLISDHSKWAPSQRGENKQHENGIGTKRSTLRRPGNLSTVMRAYVPGVE